MPRYFFHTHIDDDVIVDPDGRELADPDAAWAAARVLALQLLQGAESDPALFQAVLFVTDDSETVVLEFPLIDALVAEPVPDSDEETRH
ncbi:DUF6894 family protein [Methylobacterium brachythecii]|uniref:DUF6894 domain-containing protein n=1 Tax=Methylobacterium brachythecii TaxID=1176177 RepID=A0A7W6AKS9_9HYPH|nr:hypothetical protein [Methylobacterium brachythecii]MBB3903534.1 hypothetical protein [Methylobacterium brachythecii]GLS44113.1 hypothetical protein GCM10007884_21000 [Methylobacterium brachythecii]